MDIADVHVPNRLKTEVKQNWLLALLIRIYCWVPAPLRSTLGRFLAYEWEKKHEEGYFLTLLKSLSNWLLLYLLRFVQRLGSEEPWYPIEYEIVLTTTRVIFTRSKRTVQPICLKLWQRSDDEVCNDRLVKRDEDYLIDGLVFNRKFAQFEGPGFNWRFAKNVYLGIAPVTLSKDTKKIRRGRLISMPEKSHLKPGVKYALIMRRLNPHWHLDYQLGQSKSSKRVSLDFLANEVARMHRQLEKSPAKYGTHEGILAKLNLNCELFLEALGKLSNGKDNLRKYAWITELMIRACRAYGNLFRRRHQNGHIHRCHGDLKSTNIWMRPAKTIFFGLMKYPQQLLALDSIDFNPEFCHIDTLSDVAMLAVDIEMHSWDKRYNAEAMVCAYVSILYDGLPALGEKYLDIASAHARQLQEFLGTLVEPSAFVDSQS